uniref:Laminin subunit alpha 3 n=1 Tax=Amazona collaria TaxID=241587 RepID=A0A8B9FEP2_9PSIT
MHLQCISFQLRPSFYLIVLQGQFCDYCNAADPNKAHPVTNAIDGTERWWQSPPLSMGLKYNEVNVTLDLGQLFHVAYILIKFANSPRPDLWILERSVDFGRTFTPWQYFAHSKADCLQHFGREANLPVRRDDDVLCTTEYSRILPLENGEIVVSLVNGRPGAKNFTYSPSLQEFTKATNIRLHFLRTNTLLGHLISKAQRDPTVTRRYYYSIKDISIGGRCVCHGHAEVCHAKTSPFCRFQCECQHNTCGETCDHCCPGYNQKQWQPATSGSTNTCEPCNCHGHATDCYYDASVDQRRESLNIHGHYEGGGVCINCQHNTAGINCEKCAEGYYRPHGVPARATNGCIPCSCNLEHAEGCEEGSGRCFCKQNFQGESCEHCADGFYGYPFCVHMPFTSPNPKDAMAGDIIACECNPAGTQPEVCDFLGRCICRSGVAGLQCDGCQPGHHSFPACQACQCSPYGSQHCTCEPTFWQCECQMGITGQWCDRCLSAADSFPYCEGANSECDPLGSIGSHSGYCQCLQHVEGPTCSKCKPLYWNLAKENPEGCTACQCDVSGTLSGIGECQQENGHCYCKSNVCGDSCDTCEAGYYALENKNYFGCRGCQCDVGGSLSPACAEPLGGCQCRAHVVGTACQEPEKNYFFPDLHHMKFEIEDGTTVKGREIRFGYDPQEFPGFSWRGYAQMSSIQNEVKITLNVEKSNLFRIILRYINRGGETLSGRLSACQSRPETGAAQSKEFVFPPSKEPTFVTIPGKSSTEPFSLVPGTWTVSIMAEEVLLDYMVLLPSDYYEASVLQIRVTEPCTYSGHASTEHCLLYQHLPLGRFSCVLGSEAVYFRHGGEHRRMPVWQPTPDQPVMTHISGREVNLQMTINVPQVGRYVLVFEYANEDDQLYTAMVTIHSPGPVTEGRVRIYSCKYRLIFNPAFCLSFLCRSVVVDDSNRIAAYDLLADTKIHLKASSINFLLVSFHFLTPFVILMLSLPSFIAGRRHKAQLINPGIFNETNTLSELFLFLQNQITLNGRVHRMGRYVFVVHFYQPAHPLFSVQVRLNVGRVWSGSFNASFCPHLSGCRDQVIAENRIELDISEPEISVTVMIPDGRMLFLVFLVVPADTYSYKILDKKTVDKSYDFINQCGGNSFYIDPEGSSAFCKDSVRSLVAFYNNGALPCNCHSAGAMSPTCNPVGGQCICRPNVIGRRCSQCQTGYYGFPFCKLCNCGQRLCDDVTGKCICPPRTVKPKCEVCKKNYFSYHPLVGCESCNCSERGIINAASPECGKNNGQCTCKPGIRGRQCDQCAPGTYGFPNCMPCNCTRDGTEPDVCDPQTGICLCKENVEGAECDTCRPGSFYLDPSNPRGCTSCFCFGATRNCRSTNHRRTKFVDMRNWSLEAVDENIDIPVTFNPVSNSVVADVQELPASVHSLYWKAPPSYLGEKLSSYGGFLSYQVKSFGLPSEGMVLLGKRPDIQLTGQQMKVVYMDPNDPLPDRQYYGRVQLIEGNFRHASSNNLVSREELMIILSRLDGLHIRGLYFTETQRLTLGEVGLEEATSTGSGSIAYRVETCSCPPEYTGDSCQECSLGFYRENKGYFTGRCVPCNCNGNSNRCQDGTGKCINCQYNTAGEKCERCKDGYFGDATQGSCRVCPCPYTNRFATGCVANGEEIQCLCKEGYTGVRCERCAPGYFGNPRKYGGYCQKCNCNNNGQLASCDHLTGATCASFLETCDSCVMTLLKDLSTIGDELQLTKSQLQNVHASSHTLEQMRRLETRIKDLKGLLNNYRSVVHNQGSKVDELETEFFNLNHDVNALQEKVTYQINLKIHISLLHITEILFNNFGQTHQKGKDLVSQIQIVVNNIQVLLEQVAGTNAEGNNLPLGDAAKELAEAQRMMMEMRNRNFGQLQAEAEKERTEAQLLLARIKNELQKYHQENHALIKTVRESLNDYESKITDLREALNEATGQIKQAENLNRDNGVLLEDIKKRIKETNVQQNGILDILSSARSSLTQANSVLGLLQKSKEEYESLAAQLDGARKDMNEKLTNSSLSASKEPLVVKAEEHAKSLQDLAKQLEEIKNSARKDELVGCAVEASTAYDSIINAIKAAEEAAKKAGNAADSALSVILLSSKSFALCLFSSAFNTLRQHELWKSAGWCCGITCPTERWYFGLKFMQDIHCFSAIGPTLEDIKQRLDVTDGKTNTLQVDLVTLQNNLNGINRDDIDSILTGAKNMVKSAEDATTNVLDELLPIQEDVEKMKSTYGSTQSAGFNKALMEANNSVKKLTNKLPDLFSKIESINQQLMPTSNISENVNRIRELIQQARDAANKVAIPMRFNGSSGVEVRPPSNLEDLKGYTSLSFFLQRPQTRLDNPQRASNKFVLYLGNKNASKDYIGMALKDGHLTCVYNLGDGDVEIDVQQFVTQSETEEAVMDQVKFERIYQYVKLNYIKAATSGSPEYESPLTASSGGNDVLLNLDPSTVVFYVGGYPPDFRPPRKLDYPHYEGCIELDNINEHIISLYNFKRTFNLNTTEVQPCRRYKEETDQSYFEGTGYASVTLKELNTHSRVRYEQTIETTADEGIVFFAADGDQFISVLIKDGHTVFKYKVGSEPPKEIETNSTLNDGTYKQATILLCALKYQATKFFFLSFPETSFNISTPPFRGCMKNVKNPNTASVIFDETVGVSKKCSDDWKLIRSAAFSKKGTLSLSAVGFPFPKDFQVGFGFQTMESTGTLLNYNLWSEFTSVDYPRARALIEPMKFEFCLGPLLPFHYRLHFSVDVRTQSSRGLIVFMEERPEDSYMALHISKGRFVFSLGSGGTQVKLKTSIKYNDGQWHTVVFSTDAESIRLVVDGLRAQHRKLATNSAISIKPPIYVGGLPSLKTQNIPVNSFKGCLKNFKMNGEVMNAPQQNNGVLPCLDVPMDTGIYFSNKGGYITIGKMIVFTIRSRSSTGILLHTGSKRDNYLTIYMEEGKVIAAGNSGAGEFQTSVTPKQHLFDGQWHTIAGTLYIPENLKGHNYTTGLPLSPPRHVHQPLYFGKIPANLDTPWLPVKDPFFGCLRNININDKHVSIRRISEVHGAVSLHGCPVK